MGRTNSFDFLVIGGGIAGLTFALRAANYGSVAVLFKRAPEDSSTSWAQGGIAAVHRSDDSFELHARDTLIAGAGLCNQKIVDLVVSEAPARVEELRKRGANFDLLPDASDFHLHKEGGHSRRRIFHAADATGWEIQRALIRTAEAEPAITFFKQVNAVDLITSHKLNIPGENRVLGAYVLMPDGAIETFAARKTLLATGGAGKIYLYTSNPDLASGDGIAMAYRAGCAVANMEFFQFHPTCLYHPKAKSFLITEAMRGEGAILRRMNGEPFMHKYHPDKELAPRDIVARAIDHEMKLHGDEYVLLDITHRPADFIRQHFPSIAAKCLELGYDITTAPIPVVPAAHYLCGGVVSDEHGRAGLKDLYVAGECAHTGLHGANRLASNSLLEGLVFGERAAQHAVKSLSDSAASGAIPDWNPGSARNSDEEVVITQNWDEIRRFMWNYVGIVRTNKRLERALHRSEGIEREITQYYWDFVVTSDLLELRNLSLVANIVIRSAMARRESRGLHFTLDYPQSDQRYAMDTVIRP